MPYILASLAAVRPVAAGGSSTTSAVAGNVSAVPGVPAQNVAAGFTLLVTRSSAPKVDTAATIPLMVAAGGSCWGGSSVASRL